MTVRIGVSFLRDELAGQAYLTALRAAGAEPVVLATAATLPQWPTADEARAIFDPAQPAVARLDDLAGLLFTGGGDVDPMLYREPMAGAEIPHWPRDHVETAQFHRARARRLPILGICRGVQLLNVAMGGSLIQHLPTHEAHRDPTPQHESRSHLVRLAAGSFLARTIADSPSADLEVGVNSYHHQGIGPTGIAPGLVATAWSHAGPDATVDLIEAVETPGTGAGSEFVVGVQWHPERGADWTPRGPGQPYDFATMSARLFAAFVAAARQRSGDELRPALALQV